MHLIDTSVWISYLRAEQTSATQYLSHLLAVNAPYGITALIYQELLQGARTPKDFKQLAVFLGTQYFYSPKDELTSYQAAAKIYYDCRKKGITIRSTIDCLIAQIALEYNLVLVHQDHDFKNITQVYPALKLFE